MENLAWKEKAECLDTDYNIFFPLTHGKNPVVVEKEAKMICELCEVRPECLSYAIRTNQSFGVWGGLNAHERKLYKNKLQKQARYVKASH